MEHLSIVLTNYIFKKGLIDKKNYEIYQYGLAEIEQYYFLWFQLMT